MRIGIFARRPIKRFEPLSYDYQVRRRRCIRAAAIDKHISHWALVQFSTQEASAFKCCCGAANCRGTLAPKQKGDEVRLHEAPRFQDCALLTRGHFCACCARNRSLDG